MFMVPVIPGPPIYILGGVLIPFQISAKYGQGEYTQENPETQMFAIGCIIMLFIAISLKLLACAIQQKGIGGNLSTNEWVLGTCGIHTPFMQTVKILLDTPNISLPKIAILAGGPDWPTSVLAGILKIPVIPCLIGTLPCFLLSSSAVMTGAMMSRTGEP